MTRQTPQTRRTRWIVVLLGATIMAGCLTSLSRGDASGPFTSNRVTALAPDAEVCAARSSFCGAVLRIESSSGTIGSVAAGAHYGDDWGIPPTPNDSTGSGWCVDDTHTGFPAGPISQRQLPSGWDPHEQRLAATIMSLYGGDSVLPYQPLEVDAGGELVGGVAIGTSPTRLRHVAVWLALRSVLHDPAGTPRIDLATARSFSDRAGRHPSPIGDAAIPLAHEMVSAARRATVRGGDPVVTIEMSTDERGAQPGTPIHIPVRVTDPTGRPIAHIPVWPQRLTNVDAIPQASDDRSSLVANRNAVLAGWPSFDTATTRSDAAVTNTNGVAFFGLRVPTAGRWSASFATETAPTGLLLFGDGIRAQNNVSLRGGDPTLATATIGGDARQRRVRVVKTSTDTARSVAGAIFVLLDAGGTEIDRATTGEAGIIDFVAGSHHLQPLRIREVVAPPGLRAIVGHIDVTAGGAPASTDPNQPTIVTVENGPVLHETSIAKRVVGGPSEPADLSGFVFTITRRTEGGDAERSETTVTGSDGRTPTMHLPHGDYDVTEDSRPTWWPDNDPLPPPTALSIPADNDGAIVVDIDNTWPAPAATTTAPPTTIAAPPVTTAPPTTTDIPSPTVAAPPPSTDAPPPTTLQPPSTTTTVTPSTTPRPLAIPPSTGPPISPPSPSTTRPPTTNPPAVAPPAAAPPARPRLPRTGAPWRIWFRLGSLIVLAGAALFFASTMGLGLGSGCGPTRRPAPSTTRTKRDPE